MLDLYLNEVDPAAGGEPEPTEPAWVGPTQEEWTQTQEQLAAVNQLIEEARAANQPTTELDPYADNFGEQLRAVIREELTPYQQFQQSATLAEAEERARDILADNASSNGEFDIDTARVRADHLLAGMQEKYGFGPKAAEAALLEAANQQREFERQVGEAYHERMINELKGLRGTPREPAVSGHSAAQQLVTMDGGDEFDLVRKHFPSAR